MSGFPNPKNVSCHPGDWNPGAPGGYLEDGLPLSKYSEETTSYKPGNGNL